MENNRLNQAKDAVAKKYGWASFQEMYDIGDVYQSTIDAVAIEYANNGWIDVKDELPEIGIDKYYPFSSDMILITDGELVYYGQYENSPDFGECFICSDGNNYLDSGIKITHWMNTPTPPQK